MSRYNLIINGKKFDVEVGSIQGDSVHVTVNKVPYQVEIDRVGGRGPVSIRPVPAAAAPQAAGAEVLCAAVRAPQPAGGIPAGGGTVMAPIPGKILKIPVSVGNAVALNQVVAVMEAMKMENNILSPIPGQVREIRVSPGADVGTGDVIMVIE